MDIEVDKLIAEATAALNDLVKNEKEAYEKELRKSEAAAAAVQKKEESSSSSSSSSVQKKEESAAAVQKKEESSSASSVKKEEGSESSGYENVAPEASGSASASSPASESSPSEASSPSESSSESSSPSGSESSGSSSDSSSSGSSSESSADHIGEMLAELDDEKLQHLYMKVKSELMARMHQEQGPSEGAGMDQSQMAMSEKKELEEKLNKSQETIDSQKKEIESLKKACDAVIGITEKFTRRPVQKAVTNVKYVDRGGESLAKVEGMNDSDLKKHISSISKDPTKLGKLSKAERETLIDFSMGRFQGREEVVKILSK